MQLGAFLVSFKNIHIPRLRNFFGNRYVLNNVSQEFGLSVTFDVLKAAENTKKASV